MGSQLREEKPLAQAIERHMAELGSPTQLGRNSQVLGQGEPGCRGLRPQPFPSGLLTKSSILSFILKSKKKKKKKVPLPGAPETWQEPGQWKLGETTSVCPGCRGSDIMSYFPV